MKRAIVSFIVLVMIGGTFETQNADAGWPRFERPRAPKPPRINIPRPGPYQQKIINGAKKGYEYGSAAGSYLGPGGSVIGGVQGAFFGAGYADHQHHSSKVHNYRSPHFPITFWSYGNVQGGGYFQRNGNQWVEMKGGRRWATFRQVSQSSGTVRLYDPSRNMEVLLTLDRAFWRNPGGQWNYLFNRVR